MEGENGEAEDRRRDRLDVYVHFPDGVPITFPDGIPDLTATVTAAVTAAITGDITEEPPVPVGIRLIPGKPRPNT